MKTTITRKVYLELTSLDKNIPMTWFLEESKVAKDVQTINWTSLYKRYSETIEAWKRKESIDYILICVALCDETGTELFETKKFLEEIKSTKKRGHAKTRKLQVFDSYEKYHEWEQSVSSTEYISSPIAISNTSELYCVMTTECTQWETALKRFEKTFIQLNPVIRQWTGTMYKAAMERGTFRLQTPEGKTNLYHTSITRTAEKSWLVSLQLTGIYMNQPIEVYP